jgi:uncharacterized YigZ family protein
MSYAVPKRLHHHMLEIKKSRFIAWADKARDRSEALALLGAARAQYPDAGHHCWAYRIGNPRSPVHAASSDDGEPSGTAGRPILNVLQHKPLGDVMIVVIRYVGGIKLGAGGLVRAYSAAAEAVMSTMETELFISQAQQVLEVDFSQEQQVRHWLSRQKGHVIEVTYTERVSMTVVLPEIAMDDWEAFRKAL